MMERTHEFDEEFFENAPDGIDLLDTIKPKSISNILRMKYEKTSSSLIVW